MDKLRVLQWTTGKVGKLALRAILDDPRLELVGVYAHSPDKAGVDAGALCGRPDCGVEATNDVDALLALKADSVLYAPFEADLAAGTLPAMSWIFPDFLACDHPSAPPSSILLSTFPTQKASFSATNITP